MKTFAFLVEVILKDDKETLILRNPNNGQIAEVLDNPKALATFLENTITNIKNQNENGK